MGSSSEIDIESVKDVDSNNDDNNLIVIDTLNTSDSDDNDTEFQIVAIRPRSKVEKTKPNFHKNKTRSSSRKSANKLKSKSKKRKKLASQIKSIKQINAQYNGGGDKDTIANIDHYEENSIDDIDSITIFMNDNPNDLDEP